MALCKPSATEAPDTRHGAYRMECALLGFRLALVQYFLSVPIPPFCNGSVIIMYHCTWKNTIRFFIFFLRLPWSQRRLWALDFLIVLRLRKTKGTFAFCITKWPWWIFMRNARPVPHPHLAPPKPPFRLMHSHS